MWLCSAKLRGAAAIVWCASIAAHGEALVARPGAEAQAPQELPPGDGVDLVRARCLTCHGPALIVQQRLSRDSWSREIDKMGGWGAAVADVDREELLSYLTARFSTNPASLQEKMAEEGAVVLNARCRACHDLELIEQQRLDRTGWQREIDKMIGWGAALTDSESETLVGYLANRGWR
jgi:cytochrome c5